MASAKIRREQIGSAAGRQLSTEPKGARHFGMTKDEGTVLYFVGTGPSTTDNFEK
jgi:hypothetical protein